ncbi:MAG: SMP-30/gluconolactonase/LRE family protein [Tannerellaceae bacterium]|jgi:gluconolactonase|nr:SMP-30/gluconolactonase/LRE family protein [Tannerellaceae bacterium]
MDKRVFFFCLSFFTISSLAYAQDDKGIIAFGAKVEKVAEGFLFTEGPAVDKKGNVYFTDQPNDRIWKWSSDGNVSVFLENTGRANGMYFDKKGNLLSCSDMENEIWSITPDGKHTVLLTEYEGKKLNGPNDLWVHPDGSIYFTDPLYKRDYWTRNPEMQQDGQHLYYMSPDRKKVIRVDSDLKQPNGIIGSPDGKLLYVADIRAGKTYCYDMVSDGLLENKRLFASMGSDGMTIDEQGNVYLTGKGVTIFNPAGEQIEHIPVEAGWTANVCFGGKDMKTLFITASQYLYTLEMNVKGVSLTFP